MSPHQSHPMYPRLHLPPRSGLKPLVLCVTGITLAALLDLLRMLFVTFDRQVIEYRPPAGKLRNRVAPKPSRSPPT